MGSPYDLITITPYDLFMFEKNGEKSRIGLILKLIMDELPSKLRPYAQFVSPYLKPIKGFEDEKVRGYEIVVEEHEEIEKFVQEFVPFFILKKE
jgi:hypothetical protein